MSGSLIYLILMIFVLIRFLTAGKKQNKTGNRGASSSTASKNTSAGRNARKAAGNGPMAADGHRVPKDQDISCRRYGHNHPEFNTPRFIPICIARAIPEPTTPPVADFRLKAPRMMDTNTAGIVVMCMTIIIKAPTR